MPRSRYTKRQFCLILPSDEDIVRWSKDAKKSKISISRYIYEMVEKARDIPLAPRTDVIKESAQAREELSRLRRSLADSEAIRQKLETEIFNLKHSLFLQPAPTGQGTLSSELVELLQDGHTWPSHEIMKELHIDQKNIDAIKILAGQLHALQDLHLVVEGTKGWRWVA